MSQSVYRTSKEYSSSWSVVSLKRKLLAKVISVSVRPVSISLPHEQISSNYKVRINVHCAPVYVSKKKLKDYAHLGLRTFHRR